MTLDQALRIFNSLHSYSQSMFWIIYGMLPVTDSAMITTYKGLHTNATVMRWL